ncbi:MAG: DUF4271 domain-containing protein [Bacteroidales bacterium]|nr:DUF4271 domain-containing protein [Bacteroidales bacterium]
MQTDSLQTIPTAIDSSYNAPIDFEHSMHPFHDELDSTFVESLPGADTVVAHTTPMIEPWETGLEGEPRPMQPGNRSSFLIIIAVMFVVMTFNFRHFSRLLKQFSTEVLKLRKGRENVFDEHPAGDTRVLILLLIQCVVCAGILLSSAICRIVIGDYASMTGPAVGLVIGACALYYLFELAAYNVVGYTFTTPGKRKQWLRGFNASQALLGMGLVIPAVLVIFYPEITVPAVIIGAVLYVSARLLFIFKGFRIFYDKIGSLLYFILYLCTLEIIPVIFLYNCSCFLVSYAN